MTTQGPADEIAPAAVQNALLRAYFREQYMNLHSGEPRDQNPLFVDQFVDRRIKVFLEDIDRQLAAVRQLEREAAQLRQGASGENRGALRKTLRRLGDELGDLRRVLSPIFLELKAKNRFRPALSGDAQEPPFAQEFEFLAQRIDEAEQGIRDYLFSAGSTVSVGTLKQGDILIALYEGAQMAKSLSKQF